jgi:hypothetical protein
MTITKLTLLLGLTLIGTQAKAADFWRVPSDEKLVIIVDGDRTGKDAGEPMTAVFYVGDPSDDMMRAEIHAEFNCTSRQVRVTKGVAYNATFEPTPDMTLPGSDQWQDADDGATGKALTDFACHPRSDWPRLGDKLAETTWQEAMTRQLSAAKTNQAGR